MHKILTVNLTTVTVTILSNPCAHVLQNHKNRVTVPHKTESAITLIVHIYVSKNNSLTKMLAYLTNRIWFKYNQAGDVVDLQRPSAPQKIKAAEDRFLLASNQLVAYLKLRIH